MTHGIVKSRLIYVSKMGNPQPSLNDPLRGSLMWIRFIDFIGWLAFLRGKLLNLA